MYNKYYKYKLKYLKLKQIGGMPGEWMKQNSTYGVWEKLTPGEISTLDTVIQQFRIDPNIHLSTNSIGGEFELYGFKIIYSRIQNKEERDNNSLHYETIIDSYSYTHEGITYSLSNTQNEAEDFINYLTSDPNYNVGAHKNIRIEYVRTNFTKLLENFNLYSHLKNLNSDDISNIEKKKVFRDQVIEYLLLQ
jgi:hypothetical protein